MEIISESIWSFQDKKRPPQNEYILEIKPQQQCLGVFEHKMGKWHTGIGRGSCCSTSGHWKSPHSTQSGISVLGWTEKRQDWMEWQ